MIPRLDTETVFLAQRAVDWARLEDEDSAETEEEWEWRYLAAQAKS